MAFRILGKNDEVTTCECCGRTGLKATVILTNGEGEVRYGSECAAKATSTSAREVRQTLNAIEQFGEIERRKQAEAEAIRWGAFLAVHCPGKSRFEAIKILGGFAAAREVYRAG